MNSLILEAYLQEKARWHRDGQRIYAQYDETNVVVYQAYRPAIADYAVKHQAFGGEFSLNRMTWIKPNFLWMMYRSGWGSKEGQERVLAIWLKRSAFDAILKEAVHSSYQAGIYQDMADWKAQVAKSNIRLQWDPDHSPSGGKLERRAIQLGLRGDAIRQYAQGGWISQIEDISAFVAEQTIHAKSPFADLLCPKEDIYPVTDEQVALKLGINS